MCLELTVSKKKLFNFALDFTFVIHHEGQLHCCIDKVNKAVTKPSKGDIAEGKGAHHILLRTRTPERVKGEDKAHNVFL